MLVAGVLAGCTVGPGVGAATGPAVTQPVPESSSASTDEPGVAPGVPTASTPRGSPSPSVTAAAGSALAALGRLPVKGRAPMTGYSRAEFGPAWADVDRNGCDTRNDILRRDLRGVVLKPGTHGCRVQSGVLVDPYTGTTVDFVRGVGTSLAVQIDHVVALGDAWQKGAQSLTLEQRTAMANDPLDLLDVEGALNQQKGDATAASWLPPDKAFRCADVARQVSVKAAYRLSVTTAEKAAMQRVLAGCPARSAP